MILSGGHIQLSEAMPGTGDAVYHLVDKAGLEGWFRSLGKVPIAAAQRPPGARLNASRKWKWTSSERSGSVAKLPRCSAGKGHYKGGAFVTFSADKCKHGAAIDLRRWATTKTDQTRPGSEVDRRSAKRPCRARPLIRRHAFYRPAGLQFQSRHYEQGLKTMVVMGRVQASFSFPSRTKQQASDEAKNRQHGDGENRTFRGILQAN